MENKKEYLRKLLAIFSKVLNQPIVLPEDNFFDIGGDSLSAMKIKMEINSYFSININLEDIMLSKNIYSIMDKITKG